MQSTDQDVLDWLLAFERRQMERYPAVAALEQRRVVHGAGERGCADDGIGRGAIASAPPSLGAMVVNEDRTMAAITYQLGGDQSLAERDAMTDAILADANAPDGITVAPAGIAVVGNASVKALSNNRDLMSFVAVGAILLALLVMFRSPVKAIAPMLPVVLALGASSMFFYFAGISYSPLTSISGPLIIAMGTEFNILLMSRYFEERALGLGAREAMSKASLRIGRAIAASGLTVMGGFAVLAVERLPAARELRDGDGGEHRRVAAEHAGAAAAAAGLGERNAGRRGHRRRRVAVDGLMPRNAPVT